MLKVITYQVFVVLPHRSQLIILVTKRRTGVITDRIMGVVTTRSIKQKLLMIE